MHFPIIQLTNEKLDPDAWIDDFTFIDDAFVQSHTDYVQEITRQERKGYLTWLPGLFKGLADVDLKNETITFKSEEEINKVLDSYYREIVQEMEETDKKGWQRFFEIRRYGECYKDSDVIFVSNGCSQSSMQFIEDCYHYAGQTWYIGGVVDAHV